MVYNSLHRINFGKIFKYYIIDNSMVKLSYFNLNKLCTMIKTHKDPIPAYIKKNVV